MPWVSRFLNLVYLLLLLAVSPVLLYRMVVHGKYREGWGQKLFGLLPPRASNHPCLWFHAVSVGEVLQLQTVLRALHAERPGLEFVISTTTGTGYAVAREKFPHHHVCYFPLDFTWSVRQALRRIDPAAVVLVELELWPNFIVETARAGVPLALINGRISERSFRGYCRVRPLMKRLLDCFRIMAVQTEAYAERLIELGASTKRVHVTGSIKFDHVQTNRRNPETQKLRASFGLRSAERVFIAGSTQPPEEEYALETYRALRAEHPDLRLILAPRHKERFEDVAQLVESRGIPLLRRSLLQQTQAGGHRPEVGGRRSDIRGQTSEVGSRRSVAGKGREVAALSPCTLDRSPPVLLLDTLGELAACWGLADIAFVGGSLTRRGGQNMIEPAAYGAAVLFGPNTHNFSDVVEVLTKGDAARVVRDRDDLTREVRHGLQQPETARVQGSRAQRLVLSQQGATQRTVQCLVSLCPALEIDCDNPASEAA